MITDNYCTKIFKDATNSLKPLALSVVVYKKTK
ncbi:hypothetical protein PBAL39_05893 [Pedobacter sp. BAL39]|nr:hypothetical protein PBAL39_05893 [Pedobacter sp. BAL39]